MPIGIIAFILVLIYLREPKHKASSKLDLQGTIWLVLLLLAVMFFLQDLGSNMNMLVMAALIVLIVVSTILLILFFRAEKRAADPIMPLSMLKDREFFALNIITLLISGVVIGFEFYIPTWMQGINGTNASLAGFAVTPSSLMWIVGSFLIGGMLGRWGIKKTYDYMLAILVIADIALIAVPIYTPFWVFCIIAAFNGVAFGAITTASQVRSQVFVPKEDIGVATSFNTLMKYLGQTMMVSIYGIAFNTMISRGLNKYPGLDQAMMNKIVSAEKAKTLAAEVVPQLRNVLIGGLKAVYVVSLIVIIISIGLNQIYKDRTINNK